MARTLVAHEDAVLEAEASNPTQRKARELGVDPLWAPDRKAQTAAAFASAPRFLLLDFRCGPSVMLLAIPRPKSTAEGHPCPAVC